MERLSTWELLFVQALNEHCVCREQREYTRKLERIALYPSRYLSLAVDCADQSRFALPDFGTSIKDQRFMAFLLIWLASLATGQ